MEKANSKLWLAPGQIAVFIPGPSSSLAQVGVAHPQSDDLRLSKILRRQNDVFRWPLLSAAARWAPGN